MLHKFTNFIGEIKISGAVVTDRFNFLLPRWPYIYPHRNICFFISPQKALSDIVLFWFNLIIYTPNIPRYLENTGSVRGGKKWFMDMVQVSDSGLYVFVSAFLCRVRRNKDWSVNNSCTSIYWEFLRVSNRKY